ncbi:hypothetical protein JOC95_002749 [Bacillus tianshenii]|uniref:Uncharacterized protein n=1 Tax=Sutcliffiella tianshenii TaxID=1463404 RepID=A0ABS2P1R8_9BACI|nr:hypothetical protein [Bacillus tianshenii]
MKALLNGDMKSFSDFCPWQKALHDAYDELF